MLHVTRKNGFSLVELMTVMGMMLILLSIGGLSLANMRSDSNLDLLASQVKSELLRVQARTANGIPSGVYFETNRFVYFEGATFVEGTITNEETVLPSSVLFSEITFTNNTAQFNKLTGNLTNFSSPAQVVLQEGGSGKTKTVSVNEWGVVEIN